MVSVLVSVLTDNLLSGYWLILFSSTKHTKDINEGGQGRLKYWLALEICLVLSSIRHLYYEADNMKYRYTNVTSLTLILKVGFGCKLTFSWCLKCLLLRCLGLAFWMQCNPSKCCKLYVLHGLQGFLQTVSVYMSMGISPYYSSRNTWPCFLLA